MTKSKRRRRIDAAREGNESNAVSISSLADMLLSLIHARSIDIYIYWERNDTLDKEHPSNRNCLIVGNPPIATYINPLPLHLLIPPLKSGQKCNIVWRDSVCYNKKRKTLLIIL